MLADDSLGDSLLAGCNCQITQPIGTPQQTSQATKGPQVYTWEGCTVDICTEDYPIATAVDLIYEADETPMVNYLNGHDVLQKRRQLARDTGGTGPRAIVRSQNHALKCYRQIGSMPRSEKC